MIQINVIAKIKALLSSFTIKLFLWFWLIAVTSIISTRFISQQFSSDAFTKIVSQAPQHEELRQLHSTAMRIKRSKLRTAGELSKIKHKRLKKIPVNIWLKSMNKQQKITNLFPLPPKHQQALTNHIKSQTFSQPTTSIFSHTRLIGPALIKIKKQSYQLFISRKQRKRDIVQVMLELPYWVRISIPALISFILCLLLAHSFSKPIRLIKKATTKLGQGDFTTRVENITQRNDELGQLATSFNKMAAQLQQHQSAQQRLLGDISHELRSPMTRLQMALGLAQQESTSGEAREQYLHRCQREIDRLDKMIEDVLALSRLENTLQTADFQQVNLTALIRNIINDEQFMADEKLIKIHTNSTEEISMLADQVLLASAISNILNNAIKYSPEQSTIDVSLSSDQNEVTLVISDSGNGVPEQALIHLFTPFYRVNLARDRNTGGTGLGLAIAKQAIAVHQGNISAKNNPVKGLSVTIKIPSL